MIAEFENTATDETDGAADHPPPGIAAVREGKAGPRAGFICGLKEEARCLADVGNRAISTVSAASPARARTNAEILLAKGVTGLVSFGVSGALSPQLRPGDIFVGTSIAQAARRPIAAHRGWLDAVLDIAAAKNIPIRQASVFGSNEIITSSDQKRDIADRFHADTVDMESHIVASVARDAGKPFLILRSIADSADRAIPPSALKGVGPDGGMRPMHVAAALISRPQDLPPLLKLGRENARAMAGLRRCALDLLPVFFGRM